MSFDKLPFYCRRLCSLTVLNQIDSSPHVGCIEAGHDLTPEQLLEFLINCLNHFFFFRFMATNDLMTELQKDSIKLDDDSERKVGLYWFTVRPVKVF